MGFTQNHKVLEHNFITLRQPVIALMLGCESITNQNKLSGTLLEARKRGQYDDQRTLGARLGAAIVLKWPIKHYFRTKIKRGGHQGMRGSPT